jgi:AcrR family transcriptional regulator
MSRTDPRVIKPLRNIDNALLDNLDSHEFRKITVDMLCRTAMINRSTFYKYYTDKYELLDSFLNRVLNEFSQATATTDFILASPHTITNQEYVDNFRNTIDYIYEHRQIYRVLWRSSIDRPIYQEMEDIIRRNILGTIRRNSAKDQPITPYHDLYAELFASNLMTLVRWWLANDTTVSREEVEALMNSNMKNGLFSTFKYRI